MTHEMMLVHTGVTGAETWQCRECPRRFIIKSWKPWKREMVEEGQAEVMHAGPKGVPGAEMHIEAEPVEEAPGDLDMDVWGEAFGD